MEMLLYELWLFSHCEALNTMFRNMFIGWVPGSCLCSPDPSTASWCHCTVLFVTQNTTIMWILFVTHVFVSLCVFLIIPFFKKSNFPFMKQYKLDAFLKQVPKTILQINFELSHFNMSTKVKLVLHPEFHP